jgi:Kef-type K+ transport system membrane component KefB/endonuclease/exonuclease/phosphatase family metal-dependent hydrolase
VEITYGGLLVVGLVAAGAPLLANLARRLHLPSPALEIVLGIVVGPQVLDWVAADDVAVEVVSSLGVAFLLFLAGLELDLQGLRKRGRPILRSFGLTLVLAMPVAFGLHLVDQSDQTTFLAIALIATSLGLVVPILQDSGQLETPFGITVVGNASMAEFGSILLLSLFFSVEGTRPAIETVLLGLFALVVVVVFLALVRAERSASFSTTVLRLENTSAQLGVRIAVAVLLVFVALSNELRLETVLGAFVAGALLKLIDPEARLTHERFMAKTEAIGYGFLVPAFFVTTGVQLDLDALFATPRSALVVPAFLVGLLIVRAIPAVVYVREMGPRRAAAAGLLQATSLSFLIVAASVGQEIGTIDAATSAAIVGGGLLSVVLFPPVALALLGRARGAGMPGRWELPGRLDRVVSGPEVAPAPAPDPEPAPADRRRPPFLSDVPRLQVVTANVRFASTRDGRNAWPTRRDDLADAIRALQPDVVGFQEALREQVADLVERMPDHAWFGEGRTDGALEGEFVPIFYRRRRFEALDGGTFWLSEHPDVPGSRSWGARVPRIATWLRLADRWTGTEVLVANTHLENLDGDVRVEQATVLRDRLLAVAGELPFVLTGDLNEPAGDPAHALLDQVWRDARLTSATPPEGPDTTFNGFGPPQPGRWIDHVLVGGPATVEAVRVVDEERDDGRHLSDHYPVVVRIRLGTWQPPPDPDLAGSV